MKQLDIEIPDSKHFLMAFPAPLKDRIETASKKQQLIMLHKGEKVVVERGDWMAYPLNIMSDYHCRLAYGQGKQWVEKHLRETYPYLRDESLIAFFLFRVIE